MTLRLSPFGLEPSHTEVSETFVFSVTNEEAIALARGDNDGTFGEGDDVEPR